MRHLSFVPHQAVFPALLTTFIATLSGCVNSQPWHSPPARFDRDWQLSGDPAVAPLQVFSSQQEIWLQFSPGQPIPAIFGLTFSGEQPLPFVRRDPYVVVSAQWSDLVMRGGRQSAFARRNTSTLQSTSPESPPPPPSIESPAAPARITPSPDPIYQAGPPDTSLRAVLQRWARQAGWIFGAEHWSLNADIPLQGQARFGSDFKTAVRDLLRSTEMADRPLQPCFYSNQVLRVVPLRQRCDRSTEAPA